MSLYKNMTKDISLSTEQLEKLLDKYGSPLYVYDGDLIRKNARNFMDTFRKYIPNFKQYFAVKATPNMEILKILYQEGMGFDCSSMSEILLAQCVTKQNSNNEILFTSNYTSVEDIVYALKNKAILNLDDIDGLENMTIAIKNNPELKIPDLICFRLNPCVGKTNSETSSNILGGAETKFGIPDSKICIAYQKAKNLGIKKFGIHVMTGSCILDISYWRELIDILFVNINNIVKTVGIEFDFVDIGGGIGIPYKPETDPINLDELAKIISDSIKQNLEKYDLKFNPPIFMENGRYITGPYGWLVSKCQSIKIGYNDMKFFGLDACMANLMRPGMYGAYHHITIPRFGRENETNTEEVNVVGTLCENNDWFAKNRKLPKGIKKGDIFVIHDVGAHGHCMGFQYNGKTRSAEVLITKRQNVIDVRLIRNKESKTAFMTSLISNYSSNAMTL